MVVQTLAGYRVIRRLGAGIRAEVLLAHPGGAAEPPVALKLYRRVAGESGHPDEGAFTEAEALTRAAGAHVVGLLDASRQEGAPILVLERLPGGSLARLLRQRTTLAVGEAITILAPLAVTLARLHDAGVVHGGVGAEAVLFDEAGAPVLACFGRAELRQPGLSIAAKEGDPAFGRDLEQFGELARAVLGRVTAGAVAAVLTRPGTFLELADRIHSLGQPAAVRLDAIDGPLAVPQRIAAPDPGAAAEVVGPEGGEPRPRLSAAFALPEWVERMLPRDMSARLDRLRAALAAVRRRTWAVAGGVAAALLVALVLLPGGSPARSAPEASPVPSPTSLEAGAVLEDDPVLAARRLLAAREDCIRDLSLLCLDAVDQPGSAALAADQSLIRGLQDGAELPPRLEPSAGMLVERLGDSAIVAFGAEPQPASLLLMKGEAGWRIRQYLEVPEEPFREVLEGNPPLN